MLTEFSRFPPDRAALYRRRGYWIDQPLTRALDMTAERSPDAVAVIDGDDQLSYAQLSRSAAVLASRLRRRGLGPGDRAVVQLSNSAAFVVVFHALLRAGIVAVHAIPSHRALEIGSYVDQLRPALLIAEAGHELFADDTFLGTLAARGLRPGCVILRGAPDQVASRQSGPAPAGAESLDDWLRDDGAALAPPTPTPPGEIAFFQLSGGSTGTPKLIPRTHNDYDYTIRESAAICGLTAHTRFLCALPAAHNFTLSSPGILGVIHAGGTVIMAPNPDPAGCFALIARHRITTAALVPSAVQLWLRHADRHGAPAPLSHLLVGGASFAPALARGVSERLGCRLQQVFGMAEGLVNYTRAGDEPATVLGTQGRPISPDDELRICDPDTGEPVPDGQPGALSVRGPYTICGYYNAPDQNARAFDRDGFYHSGDLVIREPTGHLRVVGRIKDQINRGGEKIAAEEVEALLLRHPLIRQAALVAVPDPALGERSVACVVTAAPAGPATLRRHLNDLGVAAYKLPDRFHRMDALPLTPIGKTDKRRLRELLAQSQPKEPKHDRHTADL